MSLRSSIRAAVFCHPEGGFATEGSILLRARFFPPLRCAKSDPIVASQLGCAALWLIFLLVASLTLSTSTSAGPPRDDARKTQTSEPNAADYVTARKQIGDPLDWPNWRGPQQNRVSMEKGLVE